MYEVIIVGGGPAGLSAALILGRSRRRTLVCDAGEPRNAPSPSAHNFLSRDGIAPAELLRISREQLAAYPSVELRTADVVSATRQAQGFEVTLADGTRLTSRGLIVATGVRDELPAIEGLAPRWGRSVLHCPYCHGWEVRDQPLAVYAQGAEALHISFLLTQLSRDIVLCTDGPAELTAADRDRLAAHGIQLRESKLLRLEGEGDTLERLVFADGEVLERHALFVSPTPRQRSPLAAQLGCDFTEAGAVKVDEMRRSSVPGVYIVGDAVRQAFLILAAADGALAGAALNLELVQADTRG